MILYRRKNTALSHWKIIRRKIIKRNYEHQCQYFVTIIFHANQISGKDEIAKNECSRAYKSSGMQVSNDAIQGGAMTRNRSSKDTRDDDPWCGSMGLVWSWDDYCFIRFRCGSFFVGRLLLFFTGRPCLSSFTGSAAPIVKTTEVDARDAEGELSADGLNWLNELGLDWLNSVGLGWLVLNWLNWLGLGLS